jgi:ABC-type glycerol-3-phosphate transport system substrate-binding protein
MNIKVLRTLAALVLILALAACGSPKKDVSVFIMPETGMDEQIAAKLQDSLTQKLNGAATVEVVGSPVYSPEKLVVEIAAGNRSIVILPEKSFQSFARQGGLVNLDGLFNPADYPQGVVEAPTDTSTPNSPLEKHLYGIPVGSTKWMQEAGYKGPELMAFIHPRAPQPDKAKLALQAIAQK